MLERDVDTAKGEVVVPPGTYVLRLLGSGPSVTPVYSCELVGVDKVMLASMLASPVSGVPTLFATSATEFRYVHAVR